MQQNSMENQEEQQHAVTNMLGATLAMSGADLCADALQHYKVLNLAERTAIGCICFVAGPTTFLGNLLVLGLIISSTSLRKCPTYLFIGSLALADVFASCFFPITFLEFHLFCHGNNSPNAYLLKLGGVTMAFTGSVGSLLLMALDRYLCIHQACHYKAVLTRRRALLALLVLWTLNLLLSALPLMGWRCQTDLHEPCSNLFPYIDSYYLALWASLMLVVLLLILLAYALILWRAYKHEAAMTAGQTAFWSQSRMRMDIHLARTMGLIVLILTSCWLPVLSFMMADVSFKLSKAQLQGFAFCSMLCLFNSAVNPLLYALRCTELRRALFRLLGQLGKLRGCRRCATYEREMRSEERQETSGSQT